MTKATTLLIVLIKKTSKPFSPPFHLATVTAMAFTIHPKEAKALKTKCMQSDSAEEMFRWMFAVAASITLHMLSLSFVPTRGKLLVGTTIVCFATQTAPSMASRKQCLLSITGTQKMSHRQAWMASTKS